MQQHLAHHASLPRRTVLGCKVGAGTLYSSPRPASTSALPARQTFEKPACCRRPDVATSAAAAAGTAARTAPAGTACSRVQSSLGQQQQHSPLLQRQQHQRRLRTNSIAAASQPLESSHSLPAKLLRLVPTPLQRYWPLLQRCAVMIAMLAVIRLGYYIPIPGVDLQRLPEAVLGTSEGERLIRAMYGQASALPASLFDLGISAYINASILISTVLMVPNEWFGLEKMEWARRLKESRQEGKGGEAYITDRINYTAFAIALYISCLRAFELSSYALYTKWFVPHTMAALMAGSCMIHHCANTITSHGIGNGTTLVICMGIITEYSETLHKVLGSLETAALGAWQLGLIGVGYLALMLFTVYLSTTEVRLPIVQYSNAPMQPTTPGTSGPSGRQDLYIMARKLMDTKTAESGRQSTHFPILLNASGIMPLILAGALYYGGVAVCAQLLVSPELQVAIMAWQRSLGGLAVYGLLVLLFAFLPFGGLNPPEVSEYFNRISVGIKGVAPGHDTVQHLKTKINQCKFWGGLALAFLAMTAHLFDNACVQLAGASLGASSLVIIVGAVLQTVRQVESLKEGPLLEKKLDQERGLIQSLNYMS